MSGHTLSRREVKDDTTKWFLCARRRAAGNVVFLCSFREKISLCRVRRLIASRLMDDPMNQHRKYRPPPIRDSSSFKIGLVANQFQSSYVMRIPNSIRVMKFQVLSETIKFYRNNNRSLPLKSPCARTINIRRHDITC